jgi:hypothetical protein
MEVMWFERQSFIKHLYSGNLNLAAYRKDRFPAGQIATQSEP